MVFKLDDKIIPDVSRFRRMVTLGVLNTILVRYLAVSHKVLPHTEVACLDSVVRRCLYIS